MKTIFGIILMLFINNGAEEGLSGTWTGTVKSNGYTVPIYMTVSQTGNSMAGTFTLAESASTSPFYFIEYVNAGQVALTAILNQQVSIKFIGFINDDEISGLWTIITARDGEIRTEPWEITKQ